MAIYRQRDGIVEINYITSIHDSNNKIIKRNVKGKCLLHIEDIRVVDYHFDIKGKPDMTRCRIFHSDNGWMILNESFEEIASFKYRQQPTVNGFQNKLQIKQNKLKNGKGKKPS